jgi:CMP/dCMP kinase
LCSAGPNQVSKGMIVTIDGPAGAGKSSAARGLALRLGFQFLDTGAMYRAVALAAVRARIGLDDQETLRRLVEGLHLEMPPEQIVLNGEDVSGLIRTSEITEATGPIASSRVVRQHLVRLQREAAAGRDIVCEGRDQGTIVFPDAACKFFLVADPLERARRRLRDLQDRGETVALEDVLQAQEERDRRDAARDLGPMVPAPDAVVLDSTTLPLDAIVNLMEERVRATQEGMRDKG